MFHYYDKFFLENYILKLKKVFKTSRGYSYINYITLSIIGDKMGGIGFGKACCKEQIISFNKSLSNAKKNFFKVKLYKNNIPYSIIGKSVKTKILIMPNKKGKGLVSGSVARLIFNCMGLNDITSKIYGSNNFNNIINATLNAFKSIKLNF